MIRFKINSLFRTDAKHSTDSTILQQSRNCANFAVGSILQNIFNGINWLIGWFWGLYFFQHIVWDISQWEVQGMEEAVHTSSSRNCTEIHWAP